jgi:hypothetical protein
MITLAKRGDLAARRTVVAEFPNEPLVVTKLFNEIAPKYADRTSGLRPNRPSRTKIWRRSAYRPKSNWCRQPSHESPLRRMQCKAARSTGASALACASDRADGPTQQCIGRVATNEVLERAHRCAIAQRLNMMARASPGSRFSREHGRSRENSKPLWRRSQVETWSESLRRVEQTPGSTRAGR